MTDIITLKCVLLGCPLQNIFSVDIAQSETAQTLMAAIMASKPGWHIGNANELTLFRTINAMESIDYSDMPQRLELAEESSGFITVHCNGATSPYQIHGVQLEPHYPLESTDYPPTQALHFIVRLPQTRKLVLDGAMLSLNCLLLGDRILSIFQVEIPSNKTVSTLRKFIKREKAELSNVNADLLDLWAVFFPGHELDTKVHNFPLSPGTPLNPMKLLSAIFEVVLDRDQLHVMVSLPDLQSDQAISRLDANYPLFSLLKISVDKFRHWTHADVMENLGVGGTYSNSNNANPGPEIFAIEQRLRRPRIYQEQPQNWDLTNAQEQALFGTIFQSHEHGPFTVTDFREFHTFYHVMRGFRSDVSRTRNEQSSSSKASNFTMYFIQPVFLSQAHLGGLLEYHQEIPWSFPVFVNTVSNPNSCLKYTPKNDFMVVSSQPRVPFIVSEVISHRSESDRHRMLLQAIVVARVGRWMMDTGSPRNFFVVAIYLDRRMCASRYIVMQTGEGRAVSIHQKDFNLTEGRSAAEFLREMHNLATELRDLAGDLDDQRKQQVINIKNASSMIRSLHSKPSLVRAVRSTMLGTIREHGEGRDSDVQSDSGGESIEDMDEDGQEMGVFKADDIQAILRQKDYEFGFVLFGYPHIAIAIHDKAVYKVAYLKFIEHGHGQQQVEIFRYLLAIRSPRNHTISGEFWPVRGGTVIFMPDAGGSLTNLKNPDTHLWTTACQLFEAVAFMHEHNIAHMDLKPGNIFIPVDGGRLCIIDFGSAIHVANAKQKFESVVGTEGYIAPEVYGGPYRPMHADLWSCGKTLEELCLLCSESRNRSYLLEIAHQLMSNAPDIRPMMTMVLEWMSREANSSVVMTFNERSTMVAGVRA